MRTKTTPHPVDGHLGESLMRSIIDAVKTPGDSHFEITYKGNDEFLIVAYPEAKEALADLRTYPARRDFQGQTIRYAMGFDGQLTRVETHDLLVYTRITYRDDCIVKMTQVIAHPHRPYVLLPVILNFAQRKEGQLLPTPDPQAVQKALNVLSGRTVCTAAAAVEVLHAMHDHRYREVNLEDRLGE